MKYLHHYTSVDSLLKILEYGTIRFNNLADVNDKHEGDTFDAGNLGQYIFASCWTENSKESSLMWENYGDSYKGVRISIPYPIFDLHYIDYFGPEPSLISYDSLVNNGLFFFLQK